MSPNARLAFVTLVVLPAACERAPTPRATEPQQQRSTATAPPTATPTAAPTAAHSPRRVACSVVRGTVLATPELPAQSGNFSRNLHGPGAEVRLGLTRGAEPGAWLPDVHWRTTPDGAALHSPSTALGLPATFATAENPEWIVPVATGRFSVLVSVSGDGVLSAAFAALPNAVPRRLFTVTPGRERVVSSEGVGAPRGPLVVTRFDGAVSAARHAILVQFDDAGAELSRRDVEGDVAAVLVREGRVYTGVREGSSHRVQWSAADAPPLAAEALPADPSTAPACAADAGPSAERVTLFDALEFVSAAVSARATLSVRLRREAPTAWCLEGTSGAAASSLPAVASARTSTGWTSTIYEGDRRVDLHCP